MMEILAPAGGFDAARAAVCAGADAVYFGMGAFNARKNAENFTDRSPAELVSYCHTRGVRAYLALNTLVCDAEMDEALDAARLACDIGVDGIIIQDLGLAERIFRAAPDMPLHASTQMSIHSLGGAEYLHSLGYRRVVLSRECPKKDMEKIAEYAKASGLELEVFVQGALCMSVSGQCLFSALLGQRSGNRGLCAGTCRLPFSVSGGDGYDLSLKDLNLYSYFDDFRRMGITSLKIEGRMKRPEYVAAAVDCAVCARDNPAALPEKLELLGKVFSRSGFTDGYYADHRDKEMFGVRSESDIDASREIKNSIHALYRREYPHVAVGMNLSLKRGEGAALTVGDGVNTVRVSGAEPESAATRSVDRDFARSKLEKCGSTPFYLDRLDCDIEEGLYLSPSELNRMKSAALERLAEIRGRLSPTAFEPSESRLPAKNPPRRGELIGIYHSSRQIVADSGLALCFVPLDTTNEEFSRLMSLGAKLAVKVPPYIADERQIAADLERAREHGALFAMADNLGAIPLIRRAGLRIFGGSGLNVFNSESAFSRALDGVDALTVSYELSAAQINALRFSGALCVNVYGRIPLMLVRNCPRRARLGCKNCDGRITDRRGVEFKLMCEYGVTRLYSDRPLYFAERLGELSADYYALNFTDETAQQAKEIIAKYRCGAAPSGLYTRGLYARGVL